jgi:hypothetical protein
MAQFILLYKGPATPAEEMSPEQTEQVMQGWNTWMGKVGSAIVEIGNPFAAGAGVAGDGSLTSSSDLHGYTIVEAADLNEAQGLCDGHPFLSDGTAKFVVEVYELAPVPM